MSDVATEALNIIAGCERHNHVPVAVEITQSAWREFVAETVKREPDCWQMECEHEACADYRRLLLVKPGDEPGALWGTTIRIVADQPRIRVVEP